MIEDKKEGDSADPLEKFGDTQDGLNNEWKYFERGEGLVKEQREQLEDTVNDEKKNIDSGRNITKKMCASCRKHTF